MAYKRFKVKNGVTYRYHVTAEGYTTPTGVQNPGYVTIDGQPQPITIELVPATNFYSFTIYTDTANTVVINNEQIYDTGHTGQFTKSNIAEGTQIIYEVSREGYDPATNIEDEPLILNHDTDINITLTPAVKRLTVNVNGYDNVQGTTTVITQSCTFTFTVNGQTTTTSDNYIDVQADTTVKFNVVCNGYTEKLYSQGGTLPLDHYVTVGNSSRTETVNMEKSTNQYTVTWNVVDGAGNPITGYEINVTVNGGTTHSIPGNTYTGTINDEIVWSCGIPGDQQHTTDGGVIYHLTSDQPLTATLRGITYTATVTVYNGPSTQNIKVEGATVRFINTSTQQYEEVLTNSNGSATYSVEYGVIYNVAVSKTGFWNEPTQDEIAYYPTYPYRVGKTDTMNELNIGISILPSTTYWEFSVVPTPNTPVTVTMNNTQVSVIRTTTGGDSYGGMFPPRTLVNYEITTTLSGYQSLSGSEYISDKDNFKDMPKTLPVAQTGTATFTAEDADSGASITGFTLYVDGVQQSGNTYTDVVGSSHTYRLVKTGYQDATGGFTISSTSVPVPCIMRVDVSNYLTMELTDSSDELYFMTSSSSFPRSIDYSIDEGATWTPVAAATTFGPGNKIDATVGDVIRFRYTPNVSNNNGYANASNRAYFVNKNKGTNVVYVYGNMSSICSAPSVDEFYRFKGFFNGLDVANKYVNGSIVPLSLSGIKISSYCCASMFSNCSNLESVVLPSGTMASNCFASMFYYCTSFKSYSGVTLAPTAANCFSHMFHGCSSLTSAYVSTNTAANYSCESMYEGCTSLTTASVYISYANDPSYNTMDRMFYGCSSLNKITCTLVHPENVDHTNWVYGVASTGTFTTARGYSPPTSDLWTRGVSGIPSGWTVRE